MKFFSNYFLEEDGSDKNGCRFTWHSKDLHVVPFPNEHIEHVLNCFKQRKRSYKETWLLYFDDDTSIKNVVGLFENRNAVMDFDDDFIIGLNMNNVVHLWELYRVGKNTTIQFNKIGQFSGNEQLELTSETKWYRRRNMKGHHFLMTSLPEAPFLTKVALLYFDTSLQVK